MDLSPCSIPFNPHVYPLVNVYITMGNHIFQWVNEGEKNSQFHRVSIAMSAMLLCQRVIPEIRWWTPPPSQGTRPQWWAPLPWPHVHGSGCSGTRPGPKSMWNKEVDVVDVNWGGSKDHLSIFCCQYNAILTTHFPGNGLLSLLFYHQKCWWRGTVYCFTHITKLCETLVFGLKMRFGMWLLVEDYVNIYIYMYIYIYVYIYIFMNELNLWGYNL